MAEVLAGIGGLFGTEGLGGLFGAGGGVAGQVATTTPNVMGKGLLQPDILSQAKDLTQGSGGFGPIEKKPNPIFSDSTGALIGQINRQAEANLKNALPMMRLSQMQQPQAIQQMDLAALLRSLGGNL